MALSRNWLRRVERDAREGLQSFELLDGTVYYYDRVETYKELFLHAYDVQLGNASKWPEPPLIYRKICEAKDPARVLKRIVGEHPERAFVNPAEVFDTDALVNERRLLPISYEPPGNLSEP
jgi:hypothetical protein